MGYTTKFDGHVTVEPPLSGAEVEFLKRFSETRYCVCQPSPYATDGLMTCPPGSGFGCLGQHPGNPGYWCQWIATEDGTAIKWDGSEKFYDAEEWMRFIIDNFLKPGPRVIAGRTPDTTPFSVLTRNHIINGVIDARGEESDDRWRLVVRNNVVTRQEPDLVWPSDEELLDRER